MHRHRPLLVLLVAVAGLVLAACAEDSSSDQTASPAASGASVTGSAPATTGGGAAGPSATAAPDIAQPPGDDAEPSGSGSCAGTPSGTVVVSAVDGRLQVAAGDGSPADLQLDTSRLAADELAALVAVLERHQRQVRISVPDLPGPRPVLLEFHGYSSSALETSLYSRLAPRAIPAGYLVVAVDGREVPRRWELTATEPDPSAVDASDVAVVDALVDILLPSFCGDPQQLHAAGLSNGSVFAAVLACHSRHRFQAVGSVAFTTGRAGCDQDRQVPTIAFHGTADLVVPYAGRSVPMISAVLGWDLQPAEEAMAEKAALNGCESFEDDDLGDDVVRRTWQGCDAATVLYRLEGSGHGWPGSLPAPSPLLATTDTVDASELIVEFFEQN